MACSADLSSSLSFSSFSHKSNGSVVNNLETISLTKLSSSLEQLLLVDSSCDYTDAEIVVEGIPVGVHRCILSARSRFFNALFKTKKDGKEEDGGKPKYDLSDLLICKVGYEAFMIFLNYMYTAKLKPPPMEVCTCVDASCPHDACRPAINFAVELMYGAFLFQIPELLSIFQRRLLNFVAKANVENVIPIAIAAYRTEATQLVTQSIDRLARSDIGKYCLRKELPFELAEAIRLLRSKNVPNNEKNPVVIEPLHDKRITRIHRALDSDDVELVKLLLKESKITLDDAKALHYAVAYCDPKVVAEILAMGVADVNLQNNRGYTVLHVAAMRKEPSILVSLLTKGANVLKLTSEGESSVTICRRSTRPKDYNATTLGRDNKANNDRVCIDVLEREMRRNVMDVDVDVDMDEVISLEGDDLQMKLMYYENRVAFARILFPIEAKVALDIAHAEYENFRDVDLNETPLMIVQKNKTRLETLMKTVVTGRRYFPCCSDVLDKLMDTDFVDMFHLENDDPEEQRLKRRRYTHLKEIIQVAFSKDKANLSSSYANMKKECQRNVIREI